MVLGQDAEKSIDRALDVGIDLLGRQTAPGLRTARRIAHLGGEVADDEYRGMPQVLRPAKATKQHTPAPRHPWRGGIDSVLDAQTALAPDPVGQTALGEVGEAVLEQEARLGLRALSC